MRRRIARSFAIVAIVLLGVGGASITPAQVASAACIVANTAPVANADANAVKEDTLPNPVSGNVLANDTDADGNTLTVTNAGTFVMADGTLLLNADGSYSYSLDNSNPAVNALNDGQHLTDTFSYSISDGHGGTASSTLTITINGTTDAPVNAPPTAVADTNNVKEDTAPNPVVGNVLSNDTDPDGDALTVTNAGTFVLDHGTLVVHADGSYSYTLDNSNQAVNALNDGQSLTDTFAYSISDGHGGTDSSTLTITINGTTDPPPSVVANPDTNSVKEDTAPNPVIGNVLTNDTETDGFTLSVTNAGTYNLDHGTLVVHADGSYSYTLDNSNPAVNALNDGQTLTDMFTYDISDGHGGTDSSTLTITINGTTDAPPASTVFAFDDANTVTADTAPNPVTGNVLTNDSDSGGFTLVVTNPGTYVRDFGTLIINADGSYSYTLDNTNGMVNDLGAGNTLLDQFTYLVEDSNGAVGGATLRITIDGIGDGGGGGGIIR